ncbi:MAG: DUF1232 domain-containing protein [Candidatus Cloacimonadota bacterium]|nr:MAG: DUF1232 domain-containing protein [Candidatus Cloacimonadota bacterium]
MKCPECGNEIKDSTRCTFCGYNLVLYRKLSERGIRKVTDTDIEKAYQKAENAEEKARRLSEKGGPFAPFLKRIRIFVSMVRDYKSKEYKQFPWKVIAAAGFAILYFLNPFDLIFDFIPGIGYIDDAAVIAFIFASIERELKKYARWKGMDSE